MAEYTQWVIEDMVPFGMYVMGGIVVLMVAVTILYAFFYVVWLVHIFATIRANLMADKMDERAEAEFRRFCDELDGIDG